MSRPTKYDSRRWQLDRTSLALHETTKMDDDIVFGIATLKEALAVTLTPDDAREIAGELVRRADLLDPPKREPLSIDCPATPSAIIGEYLTLGKTHSDRVFDPDDEGWQFRVSMIVNSFTIAALMGELDQVAPGRAAEVANVLADAWEDGGCVHELLWEWHEDYAAGKPVGFNPPATLPIKVQR